MMTRRKRRTRRTTIAIAMAAIRQYGLPWTLA
jgi:hypothetical protein